MLLLTVPPSFGWPHPKEKFLTSHAKYNFLKCANFNQSKQRHQSAHSYVNNSNIFICITPICSTKLGHQKGILYI
jgi:hypothetical protein